MIGFTGFIIPQVYGTSENIFSGITSFERLPATLSHNTEAKFEIKFQYTEGTYSLSNVTAIVDITPQGAVSFVHFHAEPFDVYKNSIVRIPVTISIDPDIEYEKIFLNISYIGTGINDVPFKSSWFDSIIFDIAPKKFTDVELPSSEDYEFERLTGARCDGEVALCYGTFYNGTTIPIQCDYRHSCGVVPFDNESSYQSPLKQFESGILVDEIQCNYNLNLIQKYDGSPACVKYDSKQKLLERHWTVSPSYKVVGFENVYVGEPIIIAVEKLGWNQCNNYDAKIYTSSYDDVWIYTSSGSCISLDPPKLSKSTIDVPRNKKYPIIETTGNYIFEIKFGHMIITEEFFVKDLISKPTQNTISVLKTSTNCMTLEQNKETAPFFKTPAYLPEGYFHVCSQSGTPSESYIVYHHQEILNWNIPELISDGAIFIYQIDERNIVGAEKLETFGTAEQRIQETYDDVMKNNPSLNPQLITINGMIAYAVDSCSDCGMQIANFTDGTSIQESTSTTTRIKFIDENGINYMLETTLPLDELILVAESLQ